MLCIIKKPFFSLIGNSEEESIANLRHRLQGALGRKAGQQQRAGSIGGGRAAAPGRFFLLNDGFRGNGVLAI